MVRISLLLLLLGVTACGGQPAYSPYERDCTIEFCNGHIMQD